MSLSLDRNLLTKEKIHPAVIKLLLKRGLSEDNIRDYFSWDIKDIYQILSNSNLKDLQKATNRIILAIEKKQKIGIYGDYDVDGTTSCALFYHFFKMQNIKVELFQPSRFIEGYGIHQSSIDKVKKLGVELLITADCGITNIEAAQYAKDAGVDLIITDHHKDSGEKIPPAYAVVNPNRRDEQEKSDFSALAGVGVSFLLCLKVKNSLNEKGIESPSIYKLLQFFAIGTLCDMVPLNLLNLKLARHGMRQLGQTDYSGIKVFFDHVERLEEFKSSEKITFKIGPMINADGRMENPELALKLLIEDDLEMAHGFYWKLGMSNIKRKNMQNDIVKKARNQIEDSFKGDEHIVSIAYSPSWHEGVIGIVASKLVETFKVPAIVITDSSQKGIVKASARSAGVHDIFKSLNQCKNLFLKFGGHKAAAGFSMKKEKIKEFKKLFTKIVSLYPRIERTVQYNYDLEIDLSEINLDLVKSLELMEPFGTANSRPIFKISGFSIESYDILKDLHVRWYLSSNKKRNFRIRGISFNYLDKWGSIHPEEIFRSQYNENIKAYGNISINNYKSNRFIQIIIDKISCLEI